MTLQSEKTYYFEDYTPGREFRLGPCTFSRDDVIAFASEFDPQPMHLDEEAGKASILGGLAASGWHVSAMMMRMMADSYILDSAALGAPGVDHMRWKKPVLAGDVITGVSRVQSSRPLKSKPGIGLVELVHELYNQHGDLVCESMAPVFLRMRNKEQDQ